MNCKRCGGRLGELDSDIPHIRHVVCINCLSTFCAVDTKEGAKIIADVTDEVSYLEEHVWKPTMNTIMLINEKEHSTVH